MKKIAIIVEADHVNPEALAEVLNANPQVFEEPRPFLFVSEEGDDVREGDDWLDVYIEDRGNVSAGTIKKGNVHSFTPNAKGVLRFTTPGAAQHCALSHKRLFSINDLIVNMDPSNGMIHYNDLLSTLNKV